MTVPAPSLWRWLAVGAMVGSLLIALVVLLLIALSGSAQMQDDRTMAELFKLPSEAPKPLLAGTAEPKRGSPAPKRSAPPQDPHAIKEQTPSLAPLEVKNTEPAPKPPLEKKEPPAPVAQTPKAGPAPKKDVIPEFKLDNFGNPVGDVGLARDGEFRGKRILAWCGYKDVTKLMFAKDSPLWKALKDKGFEVRLRDDKFQPSWLKDADQLWIFSGNAKILKAPDYTAIEMFVKEGHGLYLMSDDEPLTVESNILANRLYGASVKGNYHGEKVAVIQGRPRPKGEAAPKPAADAKAKNRPIFAANRQQEYEVPDHVLLTGLNSLWEGTSISHVTPSAKLEVALRASDGKHLIAVSKVTGQRLVIDCGWTRYYPYLIARGAGTVRLAENVAAYLAGKGLGP